VVPYDRAYIEKVFDVAGNTSANTSGDIFAKTFSVILHVAPPVVIDWRAFLESVLDQAFSPALDANTKARVFGILNFHYEKGDGIPTPRIIISFVNELVGLFIQWGNSIPLEAMALYVLF